MRIKGLFDRTKQLRNENCIAMEDYGADDGDPGGDLRKAIADAMLAAGYRGEAVEQRCDHVARAAGNLRSSVVAIHYQSAALVAELDTVNNALKRRGAPAIF